MRAARIGAKRLSVFERGECESASAGDEQVEHLSLDIMVTIEDFALSGDQVWARLAAPWHPRHGGDILGGATGRAFEVSLMDLCRFRDGKIAEH